MLVRRGENKERDKLISKIEGQKQKERQRLIVHDVIDSCNVLLEHVYFF